MEKYYKNYLLMDKLLTLAPHSKQKIMNYFKTYECIDWKYIADNRTYFGIFENEHLPNGPNGYKLMNALEGELKAIEQLGIDIITPKSIHFPQDMNFFKPIVKLLYSKGDKKLLNQKLNVAIVGSRKPTAYGRKVAYDLAKYLAMHHVCVVSGLAIGVDSQAHQGALDGGGKTIGVLASGVNLIYPKSNEKLAASILKQSGVLISEQMINEPPMRYHFPLRNRIISAISEVVIIIEAGDKSGSLITANHAMEQGKTVFALPGSIYSPASEGANRLIYEGAIPLLKFSHVLETMNILIEEKVGHNQIPEHLSECAKAIFDLVAQNKRMDIEELCMLLKREYSEINSALSELVLEDLCDFASLSEIKLK